jgi:L-lactate utilization protein LutB
MEKQKLTQLGPSLLKVAEALERNNMKTHCVQTKDEARKLAMSMIKKNDVVGVGGSTTLEECGIIDALRAGYKFLDWNKKLTPLKKEIVLKKTFFADVFLTGSNAVTEDGKLFNVDGRGNRMAAFMYGPKKVIVVVGKNKIVKDLTEARERMDTVSAPLNAKRLGKKTPCVTAGTCMDCDSPERICRYSVVTERLQPGKVDVIIINEDLGL